MNKKVKNQILVFLGLCALLSLQGCQSNDRKTILGKWQSDNDWFEFVTDSTYNSGKFELKMVENFKYTLDDKSKDLNIYTDKANQTFYLKYRFFGNDTLAIRNIMSSDSSWIKFTRQAKGQ